MIQHLVQLRLADQDHMKDLLLPGLQSREHANFLEHLQAQVVRIVDNQHDLLVLEELVDEKGIQHIQELNLFRIERIQAELDEHRLQKLDLVELRLEYLRDDDVLVQLREELLNQRRLPASDLAGDDDESLSVPHGVVHVDLRAPVRLAHEEKVEVRRQPERLRRKAKMF